MEIPEGKLAIICEGNTEVNLMTMLLNGQKFNFSKEQLLQERILPAKYYRDPKGFARDFLGMNYESGLCVFLIHDSSRQYHILKPFNEKIQITYQFITRPEIEMLLVHHFNLFHDYTKQKSALKPSLFLAHHLKKKTALIKSSAFISATFSPESLSQAIHRYAEKSSRSQSKRDEFQLVDLLEK